MTNITSRYEAGDEGRDEMRKEALGRDQRGYFITLSMKNNLSSLFVRKKNMKDVSSRS